MRLGTKVVKLRQALNLTQMGLASACGVTHSCLSKIERSLLGPRAPLLKSLAKVLHVPSDYLVDESLAYPYKPAKVRRPSPRGGPSSTTDFLVSQAEKALLERLRQCGKPVQEIAYAVPQASMETLWLLWRVVFTAAGKERKPPS